MKRLSAALLLLGLAAGCTGEGAGSGGSPPSGNAGPPRSGTARSGAEACVCDPGGAPVVDPVLVAFLSKARAAHHEADLAEAAGNPERAIGVLSRLVEGPRPPDAAEVAEVVADTRARLADLRSARSAFDEALHDVDEGLRLATEPTHFRGRLFEVKGLVLERRSKALKEKGDAAGAAKAAEEAIAAFEQAIQIQDEVIKRTLK